MSKEALAQLTLKLYGKILELEEFQIFSNKQAEKQIRQEIFGIQTKLTDALPEPLLGRAFLVETGGKEFALIEVNEWPEPFLVIGRSEQAENDCLGTADNEHY